MAIPNYQHVVAEVATLYPEAWRQAHTGSSQTEDFIRLLAAKLHAIDGRVGLNGKRGVPSDISDDALCYDGEGAQFDPTRNNARVAVIDVIADAGTANPQPAWQTFAEPHAAAWVRPTSVPVPTPPVPTPPPAVCRFVQVDVAGIQSGIVALVNMLADVQRSQAVLEAKIDDAVTAAQLAKGEALAAKLHAADVRKALQNGLAIEGSAKIIGKITGRVHG